MTTRQKLDRSREIRLWIRDILVPAVGLAATALSIPEVRDIVNDKVKEIRNNFERKRTAKLLSELEVRK
jgi:hypothetical protein